MFWPSIVPVIAGAHEDAQNRRPNLSSYISRCILERTETRHPAQLPANRTVNGRYFPTSAEPALDHFSTGELPVGGTGPGLADNGGEEFSHWCALGAGPGQDCGGQREAGAGEQLRASLPCDQGTQRLEHAALTSQGKNVDRSALPEPMPGWKAYDQSQGHRCVHGPAG